MKLRNKKTGAGANYSIRLQRDRGIANNEAPIRYGCGSLTKLNEDWEDYEPAEPLIEDEKARKVFREWAGFFGAERFRVEHLCKSGRTIITSTDLTTEPVIELPGYIGEDSQIYTRVDLCGEEEE